MPPSKSKQIRLGESLRQFENLIFIKYLGTAITKKMASEADLRSSLKRPVEEFLSKIFIGALGALPNLIAVFILAGKTLTPSRSETKYQKYPLADQFCVYQGDDGQGKLLLGPEYKSPYKLTTKALCVALDHPDSDRDSDSDGSNPGSDEPDSIDV
ncbi:MAG: hypothetical protein Q9211_000594 [Gyalolechia sp. 1 TL-2023]